MVCFGHIFKSLHQKSYTFFVSKGFKYFGKKTCISPTADLIVGKQFISIGKETYLGIHIQLTAWGRHNGCNYSPSISIGSNCQFGGYNHITAINRIEIGDGVLTGKFVTITDNSHGSLSDPSEFEISPIKRAVFSKGPVVIEDNVWIGDKVTILPNVRIGRGCVIGSNAVVTKDVPSYSIAVGNPAKIIKTIEII